MYKRLMFLISLVCLLGLATPTYARLGIMDDANDLLEQELYESDEPGDADLWIHDGDVCTISGSVTIDGGVYIEGTLIVTGTLLIEGYDYRTTINGDPSGDNTGVLIIDGGTVECWSRINFSAEINGGGTIGNGVLYILNGGYLNQWDGGGDDGDDGIKFPDDDDSQVDRMFIVDGTLDAEGMQAKPDEDVQIVLGCKGVINLADTDAGNDEEDPGEWASDGWLVPGYGCTTLNITYPGDGAKVDCSPDVSGKAWCPTPSDGAVKQSINVDCSWLPGTGMINGNFDVHHVYFGTSPGSVAWIVDLQGGTETFKPSDYATLSVGPTYYWRVDEEPLFAAVVTGNVWSFTTGCDPMPCDLNLDCLCNALDYAMLAADWFDTTMFPDDF